MIAPLNSAVALPSTAFGLSPEVLATLGFSTQAAPSAATPSLSPAVAEAWLGTSTLGDSAAGAGQPSAGVVAETADVDRRTLAKAGGANGEAWAGVKDPRSVHLTQVPSKFNRAPAAGNRDCGPASVAMAIKLLGLHLPGISDNATAQARINRARTIGGSGPSGTSTTNLELAAALQKSGAVTSQVTSLAEVHDAVLAGSPVILNGNSRNAGAYGPSFKPSQLVPYNGAHWIVVSGYDTKTGLYLINDPLSKVGVLKVTRAQLEAYMGGSLGIVASRP